MYIYIHTHAQYLFCATRDLDQGKQRVPPHTCIHTYTHLICICIYIHIYVYAYTYINASTYIRTYI